MTYKRKRISKALHEQKFGRAKRPIAVKKAIVVDYAEKLKMLGSPEPVEIQRKISAGDGLGPVTTHIEANLRNCGQIVDIDFVRCDPFSIKTTRLVITERQAKDLFMSLRSLF